VFDEVWDVVVDVSIGSVFSVVVLVVVGLFVGVVFLFVGLLYLFLLDGVID